ncbi:hypothetical protein SCLCIDRAFT_1220889 [Scleroderma citrinum Foug A]|uniref:Uncharacterized protein n=1 Tax=Scleroderma citrinum Foug A TaxID=1036808 RepID=A0A0C2ZT33_9AGAM|nr:hypothetical protein SCLCIDRAFT_1220889 [Scleroderma citrinum Foug A]
MPHRFNPLLSLPVLTGTTGSLRSNRAFRASSQAWSSIKSSIRFGYSVFPAKVT